MPISVYWKIRTHCESAGIPLSQFLERLVIVNTPPHAPLTRDLDIAKIEEAHILQPLPSFYEALRIPGNGGSG